MRLPLAFLLFASLVSTTVSAAFPYQVNELVNSIKNDISYVESKLNTTHKTRFSDAKRRLNDAEETFTKLMSSRYQGKFDPKDPIIVGLQNQINALKPLVEGETAVAKPAPVTNTPEVSPQPAAVVASTPAPEAAAGEVKPLDSRVQYKLKDIKSNFASIQKLIEGNKFDRVKTSFEDLDYSYTKLLKDFNVSANHPEIAEFDAEFNAVKKQLAERSGNVDAIKKELKPFVENMDETLKKLEKGIRKLSWEIKYPDAYRTLTDRYQAKNYHDPKAAREILEEYLLTLYQQNFRMNRLVAIADTQTKNFFEQFPTAERIKALLLTDQPYETALALQKIVTEWPVTKLASTQQWLEKLDSEIVKAKGKVELASQDKGNYAVVSSAVSFIAKDITNLTSPLLDVIEIMYPDPAEGEQLTAAQTKLREQAAALKKDIKMLQESTVKLSDDYRVERARLAKEALDNARFPKGTELTGEDKSIITSVLEKTFGVKMLRLVVKDDWEMETQVTYVANRAIVKTYTYLTLWGLYKEDGSYYYAHMTVRKSKTGNNSWGPVKYSGNALPIQIREENLNK